MKKFFDINYLSVVPYKIICALIICLAILLNLFYVNIILNISIIIICLLFLRPRYLVFGSFEKRKSCISDTLDVLNLNYELKGKGFFLSKYNSTIILIKLFGILSILRFNFKNKGDKEKFIKFVIIKRLRYK